MDKYLQEAMEEYERHIESGVPFYMDASVLMDIEEQYEKQGRAYDAERLMRFAEQLHPDSEEVMVVKAYRLKAQNKWAEALAIVADIPNRESRDVQIFLAEWETAGGEPDKAEQRVNDNLPAVMSLEDYDWYLDLSEIFLDYGYYARALQYLLQIPANYTLRKRVDELIADAYYQLQQYDQSMEAFTRLIDADPYDAVSWAQLADIQQKRGNLVDCVGSCDYALAIDESNQQAMNLKVFALFGQGKFDEALRFCQESMEKMPNDYAIRMYAAEQLCTNGRTAESLSYFHEALRLCPLDNADRPRIVCGLATALAQEGKGDRAIETMLVLCTTGHAPQDLYFQMQETFFELKQPAMAVKVLTRLYEMDATNEKNNVRILKELLSRECFSEAENLWMKLVDATYPKDYSLRFYHLSLAMYHLKKKARYLQLLQQASEENPDIFKRTIGALYGLTDIPAILARAAEDANRWEA